MCEETTHKVTSRRSLNLALSLVGAAVSLGERMRQLLLAQLALYHTRVEPPQLQQFFVATMFDDAPRSRTTIRSASFTVATRWAMTRLVRA